MAFDRFAAIMREQGYDRVTYSLITDHPSLALPRQHGLATSYPEDWMKYYGEKNYMEVDPVTRRCLESRKPFFWSEVVEEPTISAASLKLMHEAAEAGVADGIGVSLCGQSGELVGIGLAKSGVYADDRKRDYAFFSGAHLLSVYFHETFRHLLAKPLRVELTVRETEILSWACEGKTDEEIALITHISLNTVRFHWKKIFKKLEANGRIYAITKAIRMQLISPAFVRNPHKLF